MITDSFNQAREAKAQAVLSAYDFQPFATVADIAGGRGHLLRAILDAVPGARGILFELPGVVDSLPEPGPRLTYHRGDFFADPLPSADCYLLMEIIHDWDDAEATAILRAIREAASPGATVLIIESIRERTPAQVGVLLGDAGFRDTAVIETAGALRVLESLAA